MYLCVYPWMYEIFAGCDADGSFFIRSPDIKEKGAQQPPQTTSREQGRYKQAPGDTCAKGNDGLHEPEEQGREESGHQLEANVELLVGGA